MRSDAVLNLIIAGRDTTAQALSWTFFHLLKHPELIEPMRTEVTELGVIDYDSYKILHQTNAVFSEGLRLHPSVPKNGWTALKDDVLPNGGPMVKAGDVLFWSDWAMARDEGIWGPDAKEFKPSRWLDEQGEMIKESQWKAHMFNGGYRLCLGEFCTGYRLRSGVINPRLGSALTTATYSLAQAWTSPSTRLLPVSWLVVSTLP